MLCSFCNFKDTTGFGYCKVHFKKNLSSESVQSRIRLLKSFELIPININGLKVKVSGELKTISVSSDRQFYIANNGLIYEMGSDVKLVGIIYDSINPGIIYNLHANTVNAVLRSFDDVIYDKSIFNTLT
jgi:hypothetical protein